MHSPTPMRLRSYGRGTLRNMIELAVEVDRQGHYRNHVIRADEAGEEEPVVGTGVGDQDVDQAAQPDADGVDEDRVERILPLRDGGTGRIFQAHGDDHIQREEHDEVTQSHVWESAFLVQRILCRYSRTKREEDSRICPEPTAGRPTHRPDRTAGIF